MSDLSLPLDTTMRPPGARRRRRPVGATAAEPALPGRAARSVPVPARPLRLALAAVGALLLVIAVGAPWLLRGQAAAVDGGDARPLLPLAGATGATAAAWAAGVAGAAGLVGLVLAGGCLRAARHRQRSVAEAAAAQARSLDAVRDRLVAGLRSLEAADRRPGAGGARCLPAGDLELQPTAALVDDVVGAAHRAIENRWADGHAWAATLEHLGWRTANLSARQLRLLAELGEAGLAPGPATTVTALRRLVGEQQRRARSTLVLAGVPGPGSGAVPTHRPRPVPLADVIRLAVAGLDGRERVVGGPCPTVRVAPGLVADLAHLLAILVDNALRHSPSTEPVTVAGTGTATGVRLRVTDRGPGLPARLTDRRSRDRGPADPVPGPPAPAGRRVGLAVVDRLAAGHGLDVSWQPAFPVVDAACNPSAGPGTTVVIDLPRARLVDAEDVGSAPRPGTSAVAPATNQ